MVRRTTIALLFCLLPFAAAAQPAGLEGQWLSNEGEIYTFTGPDSQLQLQRAYIPSRIYKGQVGDTTGLVMALVSSPEPMGSNPPLDIRNKILRRYPRYPYKIDIRRVDDDHLELQVYYNSVKWNPDSREISNITLFAGTVAVTLERQPERLRFVEYRDGGYRPISREEFRYTDMVYLELSDEDHNGPSQRDILVDIAGRQETVTLFKTRGDAVLYRSLPLYFALPEEVVEP